MSEELVATEVILLEAERQIESLKLERNALKQKVNRMYEEDARKVSVIRNLHSILEEASKILITSI